MSLSAILAVVLLVAVRSAIAQAFAPAASPPALPASGAPAAVVRLALQWQPQSQFAGFYLARDKGLYRAAGLDLRLLHASVAQSSLDLLRTGSADLATLFLTDAIIAARPPADGAGRSEIVQVMQLVQRSNLMLLGWKETGVSQAADLDGKRVSYWQGGFSSAFQAFFAANAVRPEPVPQYASVNLFLNHGVAACAAMEYNEYHRIWQAGIDSERITVFRMRDYGLGFPEDGLYTTLAWASRNPEGVRAVRAATLAGWDYARAHPEEALDAVLAEARRAGLAANRPHERWMLSHILDSIFVPGTAPTAMGRLDRNTFASAVLALRSAGLLDQAPEFADFAPFEGEAP
ncbi:ABC transporter substrate-binding protein [uncultured Thiodictyon sp.]|uniref:ABC transporter substrate-binding protein n=1 Tax=uncultured Thiodictyon sp. TaxID=1846217 RepID=UPI0025E8FDAA|nr:ABC transporter substrate-binding protein [uncultured Thiodictyon sp.]